jgi:hypothetical protein
MTDASAMRECLQRQTNRHDNRHRQTVPQIDSLVFKSSLLLLVWRQRDSVLKRIVRRRDSNRQRSANCARTLRVVCVVNAVNMVGSEPSKMPIWKTFGCSAFATCTAEIATLPIDTAKVRLQIQRAPTGGAPLKYKGMIGTIGTIAKEEGARALWAGLVPGLHRC